MPFMYFPLTLKKFAVTAKVQNSLTERVKRLSMFGFTQIKMVVQINDEKTTIKLQTLLVSGHARSVKDIQNSNIFHPENPRKRIE